MERVHMARNTHTLVMLTFLFMTPLNTYSQKFHAILFCKTFDKTIGHSIKINYVNVREQFQLIANALNYEYVEYPLTGLQFKTDKIHKILRNIPVQQQDIVLLYFSSHGAINKGDTAIFPKIKVQNGYISSYDQHVLLSEKRPKFLMTVIEACSSFQDLNEQEAYLLAQADNSQTIDELTEVQVKNIKRLFSQNCNLIITAGNPGKKTWATPEGSMFTNCLIKSLSEHINQSEEFKKDVNWDHLLDRASSYTLSMSSLSRQESGTYHPVWKKTNCDLSEGTTGESATPKLREVSFQVKSEKRPKIYQARPYRVTFELINNSGCAIDSVVYYLHKTMENPILTKDNASQKFKLVMDLWGVFPVKAKVYFADNYVVELYQNFNLSDAKRGVDKE